MLSQTHGHGHRLALLTINGLAVPPPHVTWRAKEGETYLHAHAARGVKSRRQTYTRRELPGPTALRSDPTGAWGTPTYQDLSTQ